ncbi:class I SAM-dependent DNA methyltransferase [Bacillus cereus]|uniref:class I SAM-dependent DNA methyltransferase n=1 Tax=Bacillus cereus TaxID=1396 RepID=UPI003016E2C1
MATANLGFEEKLWQMADKLRGSMDSGEYKNVVLGLLFLKYVSDAFEEKYEELKNDEWADEEDRDEYVAENIFFVPQEARWAFIKDNAKKPEIGQLIDVAMVAIEKENPSLVGVLPKSYARPELDKTRLGETIDLFSFKVGNEESREKDILGRVYEYFLSNFASGEGKKSGEFYTPTSIVKLLVGMLEPYKGRVYDPACGSGGMFVQSSKFVKEHQGRIDNLSIYGQESNPTTWKLAKMNLAIRGIDANLGTHNADTFHNDLHKGLKADYILANPPFNISDWGGGKLTDDVRWQYGIPPEGNANYAWIQHMISKLAPAGTAGFVLANGSLSVGYAEGKIRENIVSKDLVECIVALPGNLFYSTPSPACLWFVSKNKEKTGKRDRNDKILFIDARNLGYMADRTHKEFSEEDIKKVTDTFHAWRGTNEQKYTDELGFCKEVTIEKLSQNDYVLTPGRYVGLTEQEDDVEPFEEKMERLTSELSEQFVKSKELEEQIRRVLGGIGYGV